MLLNTSTVTVQVPLAGIVAPESRMLVAEAGALIVAPAPQLLVDAFGVTPTTNPVGNVSVNAAAVSATALGFSIFTTNEAAVPGVLLAVPVVNPAGLPVSSVLLLIPLWMTRGDLALSVSLVGCELLVDDPPLLAVTAPVAIVFK